MSGSSPGPDSDAVRRVRALFDAALERGPAERTAFVRASGSDAATIREVLSLLESHETGGRLDAVEAALARGDSPEGEPTRFGPYRVLERLGRGGMGTVYLAERDDGQFERRVAVKVAERGGAEGEVRVRFDRERRILAGLAHPHVARMLDGGVTASGRPYVVMEYVEGRPLLEACDAERAPVGLRLERFLAVCDAVGYAHRGLIVHRDLKPSNVLLSSDGQVKLVDFGIAKLLGDGVDPGLTRTGVGPLTPGYAAPEQLLGEPVTVATDVFQLGLLLYELLTGRRPFGEGADGGGVAALTTDTARPSGVVTHPSDDRDGTAGRAAARASSPERLARRLSGDLDHIVLKALRREPDERFQSVDAFADDVRLHLEGRPIRARIGSRRYRVGRFVRRNRWGVAGAAAAAAAVVAGVVGTTWQAGRAAREARAAAEARDRAVAEAEHARELTAFLTGLFAEATDAAVRPDTVRLLPALERGVASLQDSVALAPDARRRILNAVSELYSRLGRLAEAEATARQALAVAESRSSEDPRGLGEARERLGAVYFARGDVAESRRLAAEALAVYDSLADEGAGDLGPVRAGARLDLAVAEWRLGAAGASDSLARLALETFRAEGDTVEAARALDLRGAIVFDGGDREASLALRREALELRRAALPEADSRISSSLNNVATTLAYLGRVDEAVDLHEEVLTRRRAQFDGDHPSVAASLHNLGVLYADLERFDESAARFQEALDMRRRVLGPRAGDVAMTLASWGQVWMDRRDRCDRALPLFAEAADVWAEALGPNHGLVLKVRGAHGACLARSGRRTEAEAELLAAHRALVDLVGSEHGETRTVADYLAELYGGWDRPAEAARWRSAAGG